MALDALSLLGFMDQQLAMPYMTNACVFPNNDPAALTLEWQAARNQLGQPAASAGRPQIQALQHPYLQQVVANPHLGSVVGPLSWEFALVEIDPLLAFQFHVLIGQSQKHCSGLPGSPTLDDLLPVCLPHVYPPAGFTAALNPAGGILIEAPDADVTVFAEGRIPLDPNPAVQIMAAGLVYGQPTPWVIVAECQGRYYLSNGYHRAYGLRQRGVTAIPCIVRHVPSVALAGVKGGGTTFEESLLTSANPPTCGHFARGCAYPIQVRRFRKVLAVSWHQYVIAEP